MRVLTLTELMRLTRTELCGLAARITAALPTLREGSPQRTAAHINLCNIRWVLARRDFSPEPHNAPAGSANRQGHRLLVIIAARCTRCSCSTPFRRLASVVATGAVQLVLETDSAFVGPVHQVAEQVCQTVLAVTARAGHIADNHCTAAKLDIAGK